MTFANPLWLLAGLLACIVLWWMWRRYDARQHAALANFVSAHLREQLTQSISIARRRIQRGLYMAAMACLFVALAGPLLGFRWEQINRRGNEIVFALDTSRSMLTPDVKPNRLTRAKLAIDDMAREMDGDAIGIVAFAGTAFSACPITLDYSAFHESLGAIDVNSIPRGGTNISSAIHEAQTALRRHPGGDKILILVTDGEDLEDSALEAAKAAAKQDGLKIFTVGVGTAAGDLIPIPAEQGGGFVKDDAGAFVKSHLDEAALRAIAAATGGLYIPLNARGDSPEAVIKEALSSIAKHDLAYRQQKVYTQRYQWPLAASLLMLLGSLMIGSRRWSTARKPVTPQAAAMALSLIVLLALPIRSMRAANAPDPTHSDSGPDIRQPVQDYNAGTADYRAGRFPQATQAFRQSIRKAPSNDVQRLADQQDAYYNLGNTLYRSGQKTEQSDKKATMQTWTDAVKAYETALQLRPDDADSKFNRDLVKRKLDALKDPPPNPQGGGGGGGGGGAGGGGGGQGGGQGQPPPGQPSPGQQPPAQPPGQAPGQAPPPAKAPPGQAKADPSEPQGDDERAADEQRLPGQMSREEARELLDSAKGEEKQSMRAPNAQRDPQDQRPDKPFKNW